MKNSSSTSNVADSATGISFTDNTFISTVAISELLFPSDAK